EFRKSLANNASLALCGSLRINVSPARERQVRLYSKLNEPEKAVEIANQILEDPHNASEALFAKDFLNSGTKRIKRSTTLSLKSASEITLERDPQTSVERQAVEYFRENGFEAFHTENSLWRFLFGLLFWEETYDTEHSTFHHPLQRLPSDIHDVSFYDKRADAINAKLKTVRTRKALISKIRETYQAKQGIAHGYVYWNDDLMALAVKAIELLPLKGLKEVMKMIAIQVKSNTTGFPDLFIYKNKSYHFYEIKSPTDQLSAQQLFWIDFMNKWNIRSEVLKVTWK
ncbi:MAG: VRR-NUC domain-containing protein, partial [Bacteroidota bacterium]